MSTIDHRTRAAVILSAVLLTAPSTARGVVLNWVNAAGGSAATASNWSPAQVPTAADALTFNLVAGLSTSWNATVGTSLSHTYREGNWSLSISSPHFVSSTCIIGSVAGDNPFVFIGSGVLATGGTTTLGNGSGSIGQLRTSGANSLFQTQNVGSDVLVGFNGSGFLDALSGGLIRVSDDLILGTGSSGAGTVAVTGSSGANRSTIETFDADGDVVVGSNGAGSLSVGASGVLTAADDINIAVGATSSGTMTVGGTDALATIKDVCLVSSNTIAGVAPGTGTLNANAGGTVMVRNELRVGDPDGGTGTLHMNGGLVHTRGLTLNPTHGVLDFDGGTLRIDGGIAAISTPATLVIGTSAGPARLEVIRGATATLSQAVSIGTGTSSLLIDSDGSLFLPGKDFTASSGTFDMTVDSSGAFGASIVRFPGVSTTSLNIANGGYFTCGSFEAADLGGAVSTISLTGVGSDFAFDNNFLLAGDSTHAGGTATMTIADGGVLREDGTGGFVGLYPGATMHVNPGGNVNVATGEMRIEGVLQVGGGTTTLNRYTLVGNGRIRGTGTVLGNVSSAVATSRVSAVGGDLSVGAYHSITGFDSRGTVEAGSSLLTLNDSNGITLGDTTTVDGGTLKASASGFTNPSTGFVRAFGTVQGTSLLNQGVLAVGGASPSTLLLTGAYTQSAGGRLRVRVHSTNTNQADRVNVTLGATLAGTLQLDFLPNGAYLAGVPITIMTFQSRTGTFPALVVNGVGVGTFSVVYTATAVNIVFNQTVAVEPALPRELSFLGRNGSPGFLELALPAASDIHVRLFDVRGREVARVAGGPAEAGVHRYPLAADLRRGVYFGRATVRAAHPVAPSLTRVARVLVL